MWSNQVKIIEFFISSLLKSMGARLKGEFTSFSNLPFFWVKKRENLNWSFSELRKSWASRFCRLRALYICFEDVVRDLRNLTWISAFWSFEMTTVIKSCQFRWFSLEIQQNSSGISIFSTYFHRFTHPNHFRTNSNMFGNVFSSQTQINHQKYHPKYVSAQKLENEVNSPFKWVV